MLHCFVLLLVFAGGIVAETQEFVPVGFCCSGFGVPGTGTPIITGSTALVTSGEGYATVIDVSNPRMPSVVRYISSWYFTNSAYPVPSLDIVYLNNSRGPLLFLPGLKHVSKQGEIGVCAWSSSWGNACFSGIAPDGIGYTVVSDSIVVIDFRDPVRLKEIARMSVPRLKTSDPATAPYCLAFSKDFSVSAVLLDSGATIGLYRWKSPVARPVLASEINNKDLVTGKGTFTHGSIYGFFGKWFVVGHTVVRAIAGKCPELSFWDISDLSKPRCVCEKVFYAPGTVVRSIASAGTSRFFVDDGRAMPGQHSVHPFQHSRLYTIDLDSLSRDTVKSHPDSSTPSPRTVAEFEDPSPTEYESMTLDGHYLYVTDYNYGLRIFDVSDPKSPRMLGGTPTAAEGHWLYLNGDFAYLAHTFGGTIHVINVKDPKHPKTEGYLWDGHWLNYRSKIRGKGNAMYLPEDDRVAVIDISDPAHPKPAGEACNWGGQHVVTPCIDISGTVMFVTEGPHERSPGQLLTFDITDPLKPALLCTFDLPERKAFHICAAGSFVYCVAYEGKRMLAIDVSNPKLPRITADFQAEEISLKGNAYPFVIKDGGGNGSPGPAFSKGYCYMITGGQAPAEPYMLIFDVRDVSKIKPAAVVFASDRGGWQYFSCDMIISGTRMYLGDYGSETAYDITDPLVPKRLARYHRAYAWQVGTLRDNFLYVPKLDGLEILKVP
jgi:hypothetical protein